MTIQKTTTDLSTLKINYLTQEMYEDALENDEINENELYITPGSGGGGGTVDSTAIPTANKVSEFDSNAKMNSTDMTAAQVSTFVGNLNCLNEITDDMNSEEVEDFVDDVAIPGAVIADYIIEENTSGIWTYRKWHSGKAECWGRAINCSIPANWSTTGVNIALPFIFKTMTNWQIQHQNYQINNCYGYPTTVTNTYDNINIQTNASDALSTAAFMILCQGTWK